MAQKMRTRTQIEAISKNPRVYKKNLPTLSTPSNNSNILFVKRI